MKKLFVLFIVAIAFSGCSRALEIKDSTPEPPEKLPSLALKVGDKMPDVSGLTYQREIPYSILDKTIIKVIRDNNPRTQDYSEFATVAYLVCDGEQLPKPFGIFMGTNDTLYLDPDFDGRINRVWTVPLPPISMTAPDCPAPSEKI